MGGEMGEMLWEEKAERVLREILGRYCRCQGDG